MGLLAEIIASKNYFINYSQILFLSALAFIPVKSKIRNLVKRRMLLGLILISVFGFVGLSVIALDWGRFIYINLVSLFFLLFLPELPAKDYVEGQKTAQENIETVKKSRLKVLIAFFFFTVYSMLWHIPQCCDTFPYAKKPYKINIIKLFKPNKLIVEKLLRNSY